MQKTTKRRVLIQRLLKVELDLIFALNSYGQKATSGFHGEGRP